MRINQAKRLKELEKENARLQKLVANLSLDNEYPQGSSIGKLLSPAKRREAIDRARCKLIVIGLAICYPYSPIF
jgi:hypothetical protein